jgi:enoyl-CoA hydratase/carnithine racemase
MSDPAVRFTASDDIGVITLNRPDNRNSMTPELLAAFAAATAAARAAQLRCLVVTGTGACFSAGADFKSVVQSDTERLAPNERSYAMYEPFLSLLDIAVPVIGALNGHTVGGGLEIALACDIRIAKKEGGKIGLPEVNLGVLPGTGGTQRFARAVGTARALELMATGRTFSFEEALEMNLIHYIYEKESFWEDVLAYARQFCPPNKASRAVGRIKRSVVTGVEIPFGEALGLERELQQLLFTSEDAKEGLAAYVEKRAANFKGK